MSIVCQRCNSTDYKTVANGPHRSAYCNQCNSFIKHVPKDDKDFIFYFGKYKGRNLLSMTNQEEWDYLIWLEKQDFVNSGQRTKINNFLNSK